MSKTKKPADEIVGTLELTQPADEIAVTLELTQREVQALHKLTLRGVRWGTPNSTFAKDVMAIFDAISKFADAGSDCPYQDLYPNGERQFPEWRRVQR